MREQMPVIPADRPAAMCGRAPTVMPTAATAMTSRADCPASTWMSPPPLTCFGSESSSAYDIAPTMAMGADSRPPGSASRSSSPSAMKPPNARAGGQ